MADHPHRPYRGEQPAHGSSGGGDPLAELARLIGGQNDPFASPQQRDTRQDHAAWHAGHESFNHHDPRAAAANSEYPEPLPPSAEPAYDSSYGGFGPPRSRQEAAPPKFAAPQSFPGQGYPGQSQGYPGQGQGYPGQGYASDPFYREDAHNAHHGRHDDYEDEEQAPARRRGGMLTVVAVIALGLVGTAAAFGYRAVFGNNGSSTPPVIKADTTPAKIVPAAVPNDQSKQIYDRVGERAPAEKVVSREEKPVDVADSLKTPRIVGGPAVTSTAPAPNPVAPQPVALPANASALAAPNAPGASTPKRVRTVTIKPDGTDGESPVATAARVAATPTPAAMPAPAAPPAAAPAPAAPAPARVASAAPQDVPPPAPVRTTRVPVQQQAVANPNAPLSLSPPPAGGAAPARATVRTASAPASQAPAAQASASSGGGYTVQVSSQRTEAEAQSAFRALQSKYPDQLGGQQPMIRRADLGDKGVFYRVQVGPFGSSDQAGQLCSNLKSAGGTCVVQKN
jgi:hypothetical protein